MSAPLTLVDHPGAHADLAFALDAAAQARLAQGEEVVNGVLGVLRGEDGSVTTSAALRGALHRAIDGDGLGYAPSDGLPRFLEAVGEHVIADPFVRAHAGMVATPGVSGACHLALSSLLPPGGAVLTTEGHWGALDVMTEHCGRRLHTVALLDAQGRLDPAGLEQALASQARTQDRVLVMLNEPCNNPTGWSLRADEWHRVLDQLERVARTTPTALLIDTAYLAFATREDRLPWLRLLDAARHMRVLYAWTASKTMLFYGGRVGALGVLDPDDRRRHDLLATLGAAGRATWSNGNRAGMQAVAEVLGVPAARHAFELECEARRALLGRRQHALRHALGARGIELPRPSEGFFARVPARRPAEAAARAREQGVFVLPVPGGLRVAVAAVPLDGVDALAAGIERSLTGPRRGAVAAGSARASAGSQMVHKLERIAAQHDAVDAASRLAAARLLLQDELAELAEGLDQLGRGDSCVERSVAQLLGVHGKMLRPMCVLLAARVGGGPAAPRARALALASELLHAATLLHDDVVDEGTTRRGVPASRVAFGNAASVFGGDWLLVEALTLVREARLEGLLESTLDLLRDMIAAEATQLDRRGCLDVTVAGYLEVVRGKTGALFAWSARAGAQAAGLPGHQVEALARFGHQLGVAFQVVDDVLDFSDEGEIGKSVFVDLREGKITLPLILAAERDAGLRPLLERSLAAPDEAEALCGRVAEIVRATGALGAARDFARTYADSARSCLAQLPDSLARDMLDSVPHVAVTRLR